MKKRRCGFNNFFNNKVVVKCCKNRRNNEPKNIFHLKLEGGTSGAMMVETDKEKLRG